MPYLASYSGSNISTNHSSKRVSLTYPIYRKVLHHSNSRLGIHTLILCSLLSTSCQLLSHIYSSRRESDVTTISLCPWELMQWLQSPSSIIIKLDLSGWVKMCKRSAAQISMVIQVDIASVHLALYWLSGLITIVRLSEIKTSSWESGTGEFFSSLLGQLSPSVQHIQDCSLVCIVSTKSFLVLYLDAGSQFLHTSSSKNQCLSSVKVWSKPKRTTFRLFLSSAWLWWY